MKKLNKRKSLIITGATLACVVLGSCTPFFISIAKHFEDSSTAQTYDLQEKLGAKSLDYRLKKGSRLQHNQNEPIYVAISNEFSEEEKKSIINKLDHIFNLVGEINDNYRYEIVESVDSIKYLGKSKIDISISDNLPDEVLGRVSNLAHKPSVKGYFLNDLNILVNRNSIKSSSDRLNHIILHELLHCFGIDDVNNSNKNYFNTIINSTKGNIDLISPNDYKILQALYTPKDKADINLLNANFDKYSKFYYEEYSKMLKSKNPEIKSIEGNIERWFLMPQNDTVKFYSVEIFEDEYVVKTYDKNVVELEQCSGKAHATDGGLFLQNVHLENFINNKETYLDIQLYAQGDDIISNLLSTPTDKKTSNQLATTQELEKQ